jgi:hypothetical protein
VGLLERDELVLEQEVLALRRAAAAAAVVRGRQRGIRAVDLAHRELRQALLLRRDVGRHRAEPLARRGRLAARRLPFRHLELELAYARLALLDIRPPALAVPLKVLEPALERDNVRSPALALVLESLDCLPEREH